MEADEISKHLNETLARWMEAERSEAAYRRWAAFFYPLLGDASTAEALCDLGLKVVRREIPAGAGVREAVETIIKKTAQTMQTSASPTRQTSFSFDWRERPKAEGPGPTQTSQDTSSG